jgi:phosphoadenosine phosphosulfate reductase
MSTCVAPDLETFSAQDVLAHCVEEFHPRLAVATSFQKEASVIMDMLVRLEPSVRFFTLDTHALFPETRAIWQRVQEHYGIVVEGVEGEIVPELWKTDTERCCDLRKVRPLRDTLATADAWVSGVRRDQSATRAATRKLDWDAKHGLWKANPLAGWTEKDVWAYIHANDVPYHELHDRGYASIGCEPCTAPGDARDGRWAGSAKIECGIHVE